MGAFDDLIATPAPSTSRQRGAFDDLITDGVTPYSGNAPSRLQAFGYGAADAASLGFGDEGAGVVAGIGAVLGGQDYALAYRQRVDEARERLDEARRVHPVSTLAGSVAGTIPALLIPGAGEANAARTGATAARVLPSVGRVITGEALPGGQTLMRWAAGRGPGAFIAQGIQGARQGAVFGGVYGAGSANDGDRVGGAIQGAGVGAGFGAITPFAFQGLTRGTAGENLLAATGNALTRAGVGGAIGYGSSYLTGADPGQSALTGAAIGATAKPFLMASGRAVGGPLLQAWRNHRRAFGNQTGMSLGIPPIGDEAAAAAGGGAGRPAIEAPVLREIDRAIGREGRTVADLEAGINAARANPLDRRLADMGPELSGQMDTIANMPGQSFTRAQERAAELAGAMPGQIREELSQMLNVSRTPGQMIDDLRLAAASANDGYAPVLEQPPVQQVVRQRIAPLMETPEMQPVLAERFAVEQGRARLAAIRGQEPPRPSVVRTENGFTLADDVNGRQLHELKTSIDDHLNAAMDRRSLSPAGRDRQSMLDDFREAYLRAMDDALPGNGDVPGYAQVRATRGSVFDAERALRLDKDGNSTIGSHILKMEPDEIARFMRETVTPTGRRRPTTDFEREAYRAGVAHEVMRRIDDYVSASSDKVRNAGEVLDRVGLQNRLRAAFNETPDAINAFLDRAIQRAEMLRRAGGWTRGAQTARRGFRGMDRMLASVVEGGGVNPVSITGSILKPTYQALRGRVVERENDAIGSALLRRVDGGSPEDEAYLRELLRQLQQMERDRANRALGSGRDAAVGGLQSGGLDDQAY